MPDIPMDGVSNAFQSFFEMGPVAWGISILVGGTVAAFITRMLVSAFWR